ncbi:hypothetical protein HK096_007067, partial [Nowakowskiella sp. JEL0078]
MKLFIAAGVIRRRNQMLRRMKRARILLLYDQVLVAMNFQARNYLTTLNLDHPCKSFWHTLYNSASDPAGSGGFILVTGFDHPTFDELL